MGLPVGGKVVGGCVGVGEDGTISHVFPVKDFGQRHVYVSDPRFIHKPPFKQGFAWQGPNVGEWVGSAVGLAVGDASEQYAPSKPFLHVQEKLSVVSSAESTHVEV